MSGVIYKIVTGNEVYVGSTTDYKQRIRRHRYNLLNKSSSCYELKLYKAIRANDGEWEISIYEDNLSMTKDELHIREEEVRLLLGATLNVVRAYRTIEQKREQNRIQGAVIVKCECGCLISRHSMLKHKRRSNHITRMTSLSQA
jgi:hypothetical protein